MVNIVNHNAFLSICKACNEEMRPIERTNLSSLAAIIKKHGEKAELLGFSVTAMKVQIGRINGVLTDRS